MGSITKLDRLPMDSSLEALRTLRDAWDSVEAYHVSAKIYKFICKITYDVLLIIGIATTVLSLMELMYQVDARVNKIFSCIYRISIVSPHYRYYCRYVSLTVLSYVLEKQNSVISLSFFGTAIAIYVGYINPAEKWQQLRMADSRR